MIVSILPFITVIILGDPHITTSDGLLYTFNGLGQYDLIVSDTFHVQGRTIQATDIDGNAINATVWGAFATMGNLERMVEVNGVAQPTSTSTKLHVQLSEDHQGNFIPVILY